jgi:hypothetical protein
MPGEEAVFSDAGRERPMLHTFPSFVAFLAEMRCPEAEPAGGLTAEETLKKHPFISMLSTRAEFRHSCPLLQLEFACPAEISLGLSVVTARKAPATIRLATRPAHVKRELFAGESHDVMEIFTHWIVDVVLLELQVLVGDHAREERFQLSHDSPPVVKR